MLPFPSNESCQAWNIPEATKDDAPSAYARTQLSLPLRRARRWGLSSPCFPSSKRKKPMILPNHRLSSSVVVLLLSSRCPRHSPCLDSVQRAPEYPSGAFASFQCVLRRLRICFQKFPELLAPNLGVIHICGGV